MILALALALSAHPPSEPQASPPADLEGLMKSLRADELLSGWELSVVSDHPLHPVLSIGTLEPSGILSHELGPWLLAQRAALRTSSLVDEGLRVELDERFLPVVCLKDRATWEGLVAEAPSTGGTFDSLAMYSALHGCILARDGARDETYPLARRHAALQAVGYELLEGLVAPDARGSQEDWLYQGLVSRYSIAGGDDSAALLEGSYDISYLRDVRRICEIQEEFEAWWLSIGELVATRGPQASRTIAKLRHGSAVSRRLRDSLAWTFTLSSWTWVRYLEQLVVGEGTALATYAPMSLRGKGGMSELVAAAGFATELEMRTAFFEWLAEKVRAETRVRMGKPDLTPPEPEPGTEASAELVPMVAERAVVFADPLTAFAPTDADSQFALALDEARRGELAAARERLIAIEWQAGQESGSRMLGRIDALIAARAALLSQAADGGKLRVVQAGGIALLEGLEFDGERLTVEPSSKHEFTEVRGSDLTAESLALNWKRRSERYGEEWIEGLALWLDEEARWERALPKAISDPDLKADLEQGLGLAQRGAAIRLLLAARVANQGGGATPPLGELLDALPWFEPGSALAAVRPAYSAALEGAFVARGEQRGLGDLLDGTLEQLGPDRIALSYEMRGDELPADFRICEDLLVLRGSQLPPGFPAGTGVQPGKEGVVFRGADSIEHRLEMQSPVRVSFEVRYDYPQGQEVLGGFIAGVCNVPGERWLTCWGMQQLDAWTLEAGVLALEEGEFMSALATVFYPLEVAYDGVRAQLLADGEPRVEIQVADFPPGRAVFGARTDHGIVLRNVRIEGRLTGAGVAKLRAEWSEAALNRALSGERDPQWGLDW